MNSYTGLSINDINAKVSEMELWHYYCPNFERLNKPFKSSFYNDTNPSCRIIKSNTSNYYYRDFGNGQYLGNIYEYIKYKYNCTFQECLNIIGNDFNIIKTTILINKNVQGSYEEKMIIKPKRDIQILKQPFNIVDYNYWNKRHITLNDLELYEVGSCKYVYLTTEAGSFRYEYKQDNPIYSYNEYDIELNMIGYRIYFPLHYNKKRKWLNNTDRTIIQGIKQLPNNGDLLIITKSLKDVICLYKLGYAAISLATETASLKPETYETLKKRYKRIIILYDEDKAGIMYANNMQQNLGIKAYFIPSYYHCKDVDDLMVTYGLIKSQEIVENLING